MGAGRRPAGSLREAAGKGGKHRVQSQSSDIGKSSSLKEQLESIFTDSFTEMQRKVFSKEPQAVRELRGYEKMCLVDSDGLIELLSQENGVEAWNEALTIFEFAHEDTQVQLLSAHFQGLDLRDMKLRDCRLEDVVFEECDLRGVDVPYMERAIFDRCRTDKELWQGLFGVDSYYRSRVEDQWQQIKEGFVGSFLDLSFSMNKHGQLVA